MVLIFILIYFEWRDTENQQLIKQEVLSQQAVEIKVNEKWLYLT